MNYYFVCISWLLRGQKQENHIINFNFTNDHRECLIVEIIALESDAIEIFIYLYFLILILEI